MKKAIIIGATSGIGKELARLLTADGFLVGISGRRASLLEELRSENPESYIPAIMDVTDFATLPHQLEKLEKELGGCDLLIISAGTGDLNEALEFDIEKRTIDTNVTGFTVVSDWALNYFRKKHSGHLAAITSLAGLIGNPVAPSYSATKAYQINYLRGLRKLTRKLKMPVYITDIRPGFVDTRMAKGEGQFWVAPPDKAARQILMAIRKRKKVVYVTRRWKLIALFIKFLP